MMRYSSWGQDGKMIIEEKNIITKDNICREILKKLINYKKNVRMDQ